MQHPAGAGRRGELAQAQVGGPGVEGVTRDLAALGYPGGRLLTVTVPMFSILNMSSVADEGDLTAKATIRNAALRLFAERGHDAVTVREIAAAAGVSPALVVHHFGSKDGLRAAVDGYAAQAFDALFSMDERDLAEMLTGDGGGVRRRDVRAGLPARLAAAGVPAPPVARQRPGGRGAVRSVVRPHPPTARLHDRDRRRSTGARTRRSGRRSFWSTTSR